MEISKLELNDRLQEILNYFDVPNNKRKDYKWLRTNLDKFKNNRDYPEVEALVVKLLTIENQERLKFIKIKK